MKDYEIITKTRSGKSTFLTKGKTIRSALNNLLKRSADFRIINDGVQGNVTITIKVIK